MKQGQHISLKALLLVLIYLVSFSPAILFHHHHAAVASFEKASPCEKAIYFAHKGNGCHHTTHIVQAPEKCSLCDSHTLSPHTPQAFFSAPITRQAGSYYTNHTQNCRFAAPSPFSNKGPPVSSMMA